LSSIYLKKFKFAFREREGGRVFLPSNQRLTEILQMREPSAHGSPFDLSLSKQWLRAPIQALLYALYKFGKRYDRRGSAHFIRNNLGKMSLDEFYDPSGRMGISIKEALIAVSELAIVRRYDDIYEPNPVQNLLMAIRFYHSDYIGKFASNRLMAQLFGLPKSTMENYLDGTRKFPDDLRIFESVIDKVKRYPGIDGFLDRNLDKLFTLAKGFVKIYGGDLVGIVTHSAHPGYEDLTNKRMVSVGVKSIHETKLPNGRKPDNLIIRIQEGESESNSVFIREIENKQTVIDKHKLVGHTEVAVDYTISPRESGLKEKCETRGYATENRFLIIVLYGYHNKITIDNAKEFVAKHDNMVLLTAEEYKDFLGISTNEDPALNTAYDLLNRATIDAFDRNKAISDAAVDFLQDIRAQSLLSLSAHRERYENYFKQYFLGNQP